MLAHPPIRPFNEKGETKKKAPVWSEVAFDRVRWTAPTLGQSQEPIMSSLTSRCHGVTINRFFSFHHTTHFLPKEI
jgi:hypothetical protein